MLDNPTCGDFYTDIALPIIIDPFCSIPNISWCKKLKNQRLIMNHIFAISINLLVFFVHIPTSAMDVKPRKSSSGKQRKSSSRPLKPLLKAHKQAIPDGKLSFGLDDLVKTEKFYGEWVKQGAFTAHDLLIHQNICEKFEAMNRCLSIARDFYGKDPEVGTITDKKIEDIKYAIVSQKILLQVYLQKLVHGISKKDDFYYESYRKMFEDIMSVDFPQHMISSSPQHERTHERIEDLLNVLYFLFNGSHEKDGVFVFTISTDPFKKSLSIKKSVLSSSVFHYDCGYFTGQKPFYLLYQRWLWHLVQEDNEKAFLYLLKEDPFDCNNKIDKRDLGPILEIISHAGKNAEKYVNICRQYGCKMREEVREILKPCIYPELAIQ